LLKIIVGILTEDAKFARYQIPVTRNRPYQIGFMPMKILTLKHQISAEPPVTVSDVMGRIICTGSCLRCV